MEKKNYNRFFHLHTVSGIVISVGLYIIFFAGAFTLFRDSIHHWEEGAFVQHQSVADTTSVKALDYDRLMIALEESGYDLYGRSIRMTLEGANEQSLRVRASSDTVNTRNAKKRYKLKVNTTTYEVSEQKVEKYSLSSLLYYLHFFYQLDRPGYYLSGLVSFFFLFAIITGVVVHWKKIVSNFYIFRPVAKLKTIWSDAHTALGMIGLPFQFLYALTGSMFALGILVALTGSLLYDGDKSKYYDTIREHHEVDLGTRVAAGDYALNPFLDSLSTKWPELKPKYITFENCGSTSMQFKIYGSISPKTRFFNNGFITYDVATGAITDSLDPYLFVYDNAVWDTVYFLHYADYGDLGVWSNIGLRLIYFIMALITCFVIISGVLIWLAARNKKNIPPKRRRYNERVGYIYLAICLTMYPITALSFVVSKLLPDSLAIESQTILYWVYFGGWLLLSICFSLKKDNYFTNKFTLLFGGILGLLIPLVNGFSSGNWMWRTFLNHNYDVFFIDILWTILGLVTLYAVFRMKKKTDRHVVTEVEEKEEKFKSQKLLKERELCLN